MCGFIGARRGRRLALFCKKGLRTQKTLKGNNIILFEVFEDSKGTFYKKFLLRGQGQRPYVILTEPGKPVPLQFPYMQGSLLNTCRDRKSAVRSWALPKALRYAPQAF